MSWFERAVDWIKLPPRFVFAIALVVALLLFGPVWLVEGFGLSSVIAGIRPWLGVGLLLSIGLLVAHGVAGPGSSMVSYSRGWLEKRRRLNRAKTRLHQLTPDEKRVLASFLIEQTRTQRFDVSSGLIGELCLAGILYRPTNVGEIQGWEHNLQPWAWEYLNENPRLVLDDAGLRERDLNRDKPRSKGRER